MREQRRQVCSVRIGGAASSGHARRYGRRVRLRLLLVTSLAPASLMPLFRPGTAQTVEPGDEYVAMGHSFASGPMIPEVADASCLRSNNNYANFVARRLKLALTDVTCGGATTDNITSTPQGVHPPQPRPSPPIPSSSPSPSAATMSVTRSPTSPVRSAAQPEACASGPLSTPKRWTRRWPHCRERCWRCST